VVLAFGLKGSCFRQLFALQHTGKSCSTQAIVGLLTLFRHILDVDPPDTPSGGNANSREGTGETGGCFPFAGPVENA
jgi:hypothetical protein